VRRRLGRWRDARVDALFASLDRGPVQALSPAGRGLVHALRSGLGTVDRDEVAENVAALTDADRKALARLDVRLGAHSVYVQSLLKRKAMEIRGALWSVHAGVRPLAVPPADGRPALRPEGDWRALKAMGYRGVGGMAVRADVLEAVSADLRKLARRPGPAALDAVLSRLGCTRDEVIAVVRGLGFRVRRDADGQVRVSA
jgi:ATP-dependent RNA helicase SUPV3L1/SUV3